MNRRQVLLAGGGAILTAIGGTAAASETRADLLATSELTRGKGETLTIEKSITRESVKYLESTNQVSENGHTEPFTKWARRESATIGAREILSVIETRLDTPVEGVGSGVRYLVFGPVVTVDHTITRDNDGSIVSEPTVTLDQLISVSPNTLTVTVTLNGHALTRDFPVGVGQSEMSADAPLTLGQ